MNRYDVCRYMREYYKTSRKTPDYDHLVEQFPKLGIAEIMKGASLFHDWLADVNA